MSTHQTGQFVGVSRTAVFYQVWTPAEAHSTVVLVHGYAEHSGRYAHVAAALNERGYAVWALDHRGHGRSAGARTTHIRRFDAYVADLATFVDLARSSAPARPIFVLGHSMGGLISTLYAFEHQDQLKGLVLSGPGYQFGDGVSPALFAVSKVLSALAPRLAIAPFNPAAVSRDPAVVVGYTNDPLNYCGPVRARAGYAMVAAARTVLPRATQLSLPVLVIQGDQDRLVNPQATQQVFDSFGSADKTIKRYPEAYHEVLNEPEQHEAIPLLLDWLDAHRA